MQEAKATARKASAEHAGSASLYRHLCHMSEANALAEDLGLKTRYRPHRKEKTRIGSKDARDEVVCHIYESGVLTKEVALPLFERRFKSIQGRWNQLVVSKADKQSGSAAKASKSGPVRSGNGQVAIPVTGTTAVAAESGGARPTHLLGQEEQDALQCQIKRVTLETLALADRMWQQLHELEKDHKPLNPFVIH